MLSPPFIATSIFSVEFIITLHAIYWNLYPIDGRDLPLLVVPLFKLEYQPWV